MDYANQKIDNRFGGNVFFLLADHIDFAIQRMQKHINLQLPLFCEVKYLYPQEAELARVALEIIQKDLGSSFPKKSRPIPVTRPMVTPDKTTSSKQAPFTVCG